MDLGDSMSRHAPWCNGNHSTEQSGNLEDPSLEVSPPVPSVCWELASHWKFQEVTEHASVRT